MTIKYNILFDNYYTRKFIVVNSVKYNGIVIINDLEKPEADLICNDLNAFVQEQDKALTAKINSIKQLLESRK